jgi:hypothetical protein
VSERDWFLLSVGAVIGANVALVASVILNNFLYSRYLRKKT